MNLNDYRDEVKEFLIKINSFGVNQEQKLAWLEKEFHLLKLAVKNSDNKAISHQIYDMMYLLFEIAVDNDSDLNSEWIKGKKKKGLSYLSWTYAWAEVKKLYPSANYKVYETESGCIYFTDGKTCWVKTGVTIDDLEHIEYLPVMDYRNKSILLEDITSFDVNKSIQRSLTKALARHGLGLYIYAGEDLPEIETERIAQKDAVILKNMVNKMDSEGAIYSMILKRYEVKNFKELSLKQYQDILSGLNEMARRNEERNASKV